MKNKIFSRQLALVLGATIAGSIALPVHAQESSVIEEITITARKREEGLMDIPLSVSLVDRTTITNANLTDINDLEKLTPGLKMNSAFGRHVDRAVIRGVSAVSQGNLAGYFVDGIYVSGSLQALDFESIDRVEVLKGPQSAAFGRRTFSGAINYVTSLPTEDLTGRIEVKVGENGREEISAAVSDTIGSFGYRVNARTSEYDGDFDNTLEGGPSVGGQSGDSINATFRFDVSDATTVQANVSYTEIDDESYVLTLQPSSERNCTFGTELLYCGTLKADTPVKMGGYLDNSDYGLASETLRTSIRLEHSFDGADFSWTSAYNTYDSTDGRDITFRAMQDTIYYPASYFHRTDESEGDDISHEVWLRGSAMDKRMSWSAGAYYYDQGLTDKAKDGDGVSDTLETVDITNIAFMGAVEYDFSEAFTMGLELRFAEDEITQSNAFDGNGGIKYNDTFDSTTHRLTASYKLDNGAMIYGNWSVGVTPGDFNTDDGLPENLISVDEQELEQFEIGLKAEISETLNLTAAVFMMEWTDEVREERIMGEGGEFVSYNANQGDSDINGVEMNVNWQALSSLLISGGFSYNDAKVGDYVSTDDDDIAVTGDGDLSGARLPLSPEWEGHVAGTHSLSFDNGLNLVSRLDLSYQGSRFTGIQNLAETGSETLVNLNIALSGELWRVALWGKNITDEDSVVSSLAYYEFDTLTPSWSWAPSFAVTPRTGAEWGVTASYKF